MTRTAIFIYIMAVYIEQKRSKYNEELFSTSYFTMKQRFTT